jgi:hypothetical protein
MITTIELHTRDDHTLRSVASTLTTVEGIDEVAVDDRASAIHVRWDPEMMDVGEILTLIGQDGIEVLDVQEGSERPA